MTMLLVMRYQYVVALILVFFVKAALLSVP